MGFFDWLLGKRAGPHSGHQPLSPAPQGAPSTVAAEAELARVFARGVSARLAGKYQEALHDFDGLIAAAPAHASTYKALFERARCLQFLKRYDEALAVYEQVIRDLQARVGGLPAHAHVDPGSPFVYLDDAMYHRAYVLYEMGRGSEAETVFRELTRMSSPGEVLDLGTPTTSHRDDSAAMLQIIAEERQRKAQVAPPAGTGGMQLQWQILNGAEVKHAIKWEDFGRGTTLSDEGFAGPEVASVILIPRAKTIPALLRIAGTVQCHGCRAKFPFEFIHAGSPFKDTYIKGRTCPCGNVLQYLLRRCTLPDNEGVILAAKPSTSVWGQRSSPLKLFVEEVAEITESEAKVRELQTPEGIEADFVKNELRKERPDVFVYRPRTDHGDRAVAGSREGVVPRSNWVRKGATSLPC